MAKISFGLVSVMMYIKHRQMLFFNLDMIFPHLQKAIQRNERAMYNKRPHSKYKTLCNSVVSLFHSEAGRHGFDMMPWTFHNRPEISRINSEFALIIIHDRVLQLSCFQTHFFFDYFSGE